VEWRWVVVASFLVVAASSIPYLVAWQHETPDRVFSGCILLVEDCYSYLAKMRQGADGAWLFHIPYTPEEHPGTLVYAFHLLLGKVATLVPGGNLTGKLVLVYHLARVTFGLGLLLTVYRFLAALTKGVMVRRLAWLMVAIGGGFGWLLTLLGKTRWLGDAPLDLFRSEGFAFIALYSFPHRSAAQSLLFGGFLCLLKAWDTIGAADDTVADRAPHGAGASSAGTPTGDVAQRTVLGLPDPSSPRWAIAAGLLWLVMGLIVPFYVAVAWAVAGAGWIVLAVREKGGEGRLRPSGFRRRPLTGAGACKPTEENAARGTSQNPRGLSRLGELVLFARRLPWGRAALAGIAVLISAPVVIYSAWVFSSDPVYASWAAQNQILSPHPLHYLAAYGPPLTLAAFAVRDVWHDQGDAWLALTWVAVVPLLVYLPVNVQLRLLTGFQVPLSLLAARGAARLRDRGRSSLALALLSPMVLTSLLILVSSSIWMTRQPFPSFRDGAEVAALDWLVTRCQPGDVVLTAYDTGAYLPARVNARVLAGHDLEAMDAEEKKALITRFFDETADDAWRQQFLTRYGVDYVFWGPAERRLGDFEPATAPYLSQAYQVEPYSLFTVEQ
jgi:hypothetical protein